MNPLSSKSDKVIFIYLVLIALTIRIVFMLAFKFDGLYGQDAYAYYDWTKEFIAAISSFQIPPKFYWPCGYFILSSLFSFICFDSVHTGTLALSLISGSLVAGAVYLLSLELFKNYFDEEKTKRLSVISGLIACFSGVMIKSSVVIMSDAPGLLFLLFGMYFLVRYYNTLVRKNLVYSLMLFSFAVMIRYLSVLVVVVIAIVILYLLITSPQRKKIITDIFIASLAGLIIFIPEIYYISNYGISYFQSNVDAPSWIASWTPLNYFSRDFFSADGEYHYRFWNGIHNAAPVFHPLYLSLFGITFVIGLFAIFKNKNKQLILFCITWILAFYLYLAGNPFQSLRYTMSFLPALIIISVYGIGYLKLKKKIINVFIMCGCILLLLYAGFHFTEFKKQKDKELEVAAWVDKNIPPGSKLFAFDVTAALNHYSSFRVQEFFNITEQTLKNKIDSSSVQMYFILPVEKINTQRKGLPLQRTYNYLINNYHPAIVDSLNHLTIYRLAK